MKQKQIRIHLSHFFQTQYAFGLSVLLILFLSSFFRLYHLNTNPPGFFCDEAAIGYNAYTIFTTGKDEYGLSYPLFFRSFGDYRLPIPIYANAFFTAFFGMSEIGVRFTAVFFGVVSILFTTLLVRELLNKLAGIVTGFLMAITPWHIQMSRWGSEYIYFISLYSIALFFFVKATKNPFFIPWTYVFFALAMYTYYPTLFITPLFLIAITLSFCMNKKKQIKHVILGVFLFFFLCLPLFQAFANGTLLTRWNSVNAQPISLQTRLQQATKTYLDDFSLDFLFIKGDLDFPGHFISRHSVRGVGELYIFELPLIITGLIFILWKKRKKEFLVLLYLLLLFPLGSAVTQDGPLATRSSIGILPLTILGGIGLWVLIHAFTRMNVLKQISLYCILSVYLFITISNYAYLLFVQYPLYSADFWGWQFGARDIIHYFVLNERNYDELYMMGEFNAPEIFFKFYAPYDCRNCTLGVPDQNYRPDRKQLFAVTPMYLQDHREYHFKTLQTIYYPNQTIAFKIGEIVE